MPSHSLLFETDVPSPTGKITLGAYLLDNESRARFTVLDADNEEDFKNLLKAYEDLKRLNIPSYIESSRRGGHMWLFFRNPIPGQSAKGFGNGIVKTYGLGKTEVFPKQSSVTSGPGSLIRMPFGIHKKTGHRYPFVTSAGEPIGDYRYQLKTLCHPETVPKEALDMFQYKEPRIRRQFANGHNKLRDIALMEFLAQYVDLRPISSGAIGFCPFHDDEQPSFSVNSKGNYWNCFAGCGGGDIVSFWMKYRKCDYATAVKELEEVLYGHAT